LAGPLLRNGGAIRPALFLQRVKTFYLAVELIHHAALQRHCGINIVIRVLRGQSRTRADRDGADNLETAPKLTQSTGHRCGVNRCWRWVGN
jgi:hypothetical protein